MLPLAGLIAPDSLSPTSLLIHQRKEFLPLCSLVFFRDLSLAGLSLLSISQFEVEVPLCTSWQSQDFPERHAGKFGPSPVTLYFQAQAAGPRPTHPEARLLCIHPPLPTSPQPASNAENHLFCVLKAWKHPILHPYRPPTAFQFPVQTPDLSSQLN